jgi:hypothetical protein
MTKVEISVTGKGLKRVISQGHISHVTTHDLQECSWKAWQVPIAQTHPALRFFEVDSCNTMCPYVCCVYCPDPVWIPSVHACVDLSFVSSRQYKNVTHARVDSQRFALAWGVALADGGHHGDAGAWCSGLSQRLHSYGSTNCSRSTLSGKSDDLRIIPVTRATVTSDTPQAIPPQTAQNTLKDLETKKIQRESSSYQADGRQRFRLHFGASGPREADRHNSSRRLHHHR